MKARRRLDAELVARGLAASRSQAVEMIEEGKVTVGGAPALNPTRQVQAGEPLNILGPPPKFVGRGGFKLEAALDHFEIDVENRRAIDVGASTGGFTDCLLQRGATSVLALDVGHGQLHESLRADQRVTVLERTNVRSTTLETLDVAAFDFVAVDVSFISLRTVAAALIGLAAPGADIVALIKPQFEAGRQQVSKGRGVIKDRPIWAEVLREVLAALNALKAATMGVMISPVLGAEGNVEFLGWFQAGGLEAAFDDRVIDIDGMLEELLDAAEKTSQGGRP